MGNPIRGPPYEQLLNKTHPARNMLGCEFKHRYLHVSELEKHHSILNTWFYSRIWSQSLKWKCCHCGEFFITGCTRLQLLPVKNILWKWHFQFNDLKSYHMEYFNDKVISIRLQSLKWDSKSRPQRWVMGSLLWVVFENLLFYSQILQHYYSVVCCCHSIT